MLYIRNIVVLWTFEVTINVHLYGLCLGRYVTTFSSQNAFAHAIGDPTVITGEARCESYATQWIPTKAAGWLSHYNWSLSWLYILAVFNEKCYNMLSHWSVQIRKNNDERRAYLDVAEDMWDLTCVLGLENLLLILCLDQQLPWSQN